MNLPGSVKSNDKTSVNASGPELCRFSKDINEFLFKAPMVAKKSDDFIYS